MKRSGKTVSVRLPVLEYETLKRLRAAGEAGSIAGAVRAALDAWLAAVVHKHENLRDRTAALERCVDALDAKVRELQNAGQRTEDRAGGVEDSVRSGGVTPPAEKGGRK